MSKFKLLVLDVDGTLTPYLGVPLKQRVIEAVNKAAEKMFVTLCTGRSMEDLINEFKQLDVLTSYHALESGALLIGPNLKTEYHKTIPYEIIERSVKIAGEVPFEYGFCENAHWQRSITDIKDKRGVSIVGFHVENRKIASDLAIKLKMFEDIVDITIGSSIYNNPEQRAVMLTLKGANKKSALTYIQKKLRVEKEETVCIGDMPNDLPMFEVSGFKVAMGNADQLLKNKADWITESIDNDGAAIAIEKYCL